MLKNDLLNANGQHPKELKTTKESWLEKSHRVSLFIKSRDCTYKIILLVLEVIICSRLRTVVLRDFYIHFPAWSVESESFQ